MCHCDKKMLGQKVIDFAANATLKFKNDEAKLAAAFQIAFLGCFVFHFPIMRVGMGSFLMMDVSISLRLLFFFLQTLSLGLGHIQNSGQHFYLSCLPGFAKNFD